MNLAVVDCAENTFGKECANTCTCNLTNVASPCNNVDGACNCKAGYDPGAKCERGKTKDTTYKGLRYFYYAVVTKLPYGTEKIQFFLISFENILRCLCTLPVIVGICLSKYLFSLRKKGTHPTFCSFYENTTRK